MKRLLPNVQTRLLAGAYLVAVVWWLLIYLTGAKDETQNYLYGAFLGFIPLLGGGMGIFMARKWGFPASALGKAVGFLSFGLVTWSIGTFIFAYYNVVLEVEVPYPSLADAAYLISWPLWAIGVVNLSKATGAKYGLRSSGGKAMLLLIPLIVIAVSYYLLVVVARGGGFDFTETTVPKVFFDLAYPIGDVVILALATLVYGLSFRYFGGRFKYAAYLVLGGFVLNYVSDFAFSYTTTLETFFVASWVDLLFTTTMFVLSFGVNTLDVAENIGSSVV